MRPITRLNILALVALLASGVAACDDDNPVGNGNGNGNGNGSNAVLVTGNITSDRTFFADSVYVLRGFVEITAGATLTVQAGTELISEIGTRGALVTLRGEGGQPSGRLVVQGTEADPVIFRPGTLQEAQAGLAPAQVTSCTRNDASGIVLHGNAPVNQPSPISEGIGVGFGGDDPNDDSGDIQFLVIVCPGTEIAPDNEINGLTFAGVGAGTHISHVQVHLGGDDGYEWFGGTVNADHLITSGEDDDGFDCDFGWTGTVQFGLVIQDTDLANRGIECDNDGDGSSLTPITAPTFWNVTFVGAGIEVANDDVNELFLRRNSAPSIYNAIIANFGNLGVAIDGSGSQAQAASGELDLDNILFFGNKALASAAAQAATECLLQNVNFRTDGGYVTDGVADAFGDGGAATFLCDDPLFTSVNLADPINGTTPDLRPQAGSPALDAANARTPSGSGIVDGGATYLGAFDGSDDWTAGWTVWVDAN